jgi:hypothetical protein
MERKPKRDFLFIDETGDPGRNFLLPTFTNILQCDSRYVPALQFTDATVHIVKEYLFGMRESVDGRMLSCLNLVNVSDPRQPVRIIIK